MNKIPPVGASIAAICASIVLVWALTGCKFFGADAAPPSRTESYLFDVITNLVPRQVWKTNFVDVTVPVFVLKTNEQNEITQLTNTVIVQKIDLVSATNWVNEYSWTPKTNTVQYAQTAGTFANFAVPGSGGALAGLLTAGLLAWGKLRSSKKTNTTLVQGTETLLELIQALPNGSQNVSAAKQFLRTDQEDAGVRERIKDILKNDIDKGDAKVAAVEIKTEVDRLKA